MMGKHRDLLDEYNRKLKRDTIKTLIIGTITVVCAFGAYILMGKNTDVEDI